MLGHHKPECWLQWRHNERDGVSDHQPHDCLLNRLFRRRSKKTSNLRRTGLCAENSPVTGEFSAQMVSNVKNIYLMTSSWTTISWNLPWNGERHFNMVLRRNDMIKSVLNVWVNGIGLKKNQKHKYTYFNFYGNLLTTRLSYLWHKKGNF